MTTRRLIRPGRLHRLFDVADVADVTAPQSFRLPPKRDVFGVPVSVTDYDELVRLVVAHAAARRPLAVQFVSAHGLTLAARDRAFAKVARGFDISASDGQPVRWALNRFHAAGLDGRVYGPEATRRTLAACERARIGVYFYGGTQGSLAKLLGRVRAAHPRLIVSGGESPPFRPLTDAEHDAVAARVNASGAGVLLVGLGCPKQEQFVHRHRRDVAAVQLAVGAAFDFLAGTKPTAPRWMQRNGLEWLFRLGCEPRRLWRRYLVHNSRFAWLWLRAELTRGRTPAAQDISIRPALLARTRRLPVHALPDPPSWKCNPPPPAPTSRPKPTCTASTSA